LKEVKFHRDALIKDPSDSILKKTKYGNRIRSGTYRRFTIVEKCGGRYLFFLEFVGFPDRKDWVWTEDSQLRNEDGSYYDLVREYLVSICGEMISFLW